jgi:hypothetical protein
VNLKSLLDFEAQQGGTQPTGWTASPASTVFADNETVHSGHWSVRLERNAASEGQFSTLHTYIPIDFSGNTVELRGFLRTSEVTEFAGLWMREDGDTPALAFDNMQQRQLKGSTDWTEYSITLPLQPDARKLFLGVLLVGTGKTWADDLKLLVDGKPVWDAPAAPIVTTALDRDHAFDAGSGITLNHLSPVQIDNLATLGKVWGFLKYHHPAITAGQRHWDYELFRILPKVLAAPDRAAANSVLLQWVRSLGDVPACTACAKLSSADLNFAPDIGWLRDEFVLGADLSRALRNIHDARTGKQFYVSLAREVGNPVFSHELPYDSVKLPDPGFQLLGLYRFWNVVEYWSPYRNIIGEDWGRVLTDFIPRIALAQDHDSYVREMMALIARLHDGHANIWSALQSRPPAGPCELPVDIRFINDQPVVAGWLSDTAAQSSGLALGDIITQLDGTPVKDLLPKWEPYYGESNRAALLRDIGEALTRRPLCPDAPHRHARRPRRYASADPSRAEYEAPLARPAGSGVSHPAQQHRLPETLTRQSDGSHAISATGRKRKRPDHRHPQLSFRFHGLRTRHAPRLAFHAVRVLHRRRSLQSRRIPLHTRRVARASGTSLQQEGHRAGRRNFHEPGRIHCDGIPRCGRYYHRQHYERCRR